jgi:hypothetical protein
LRLWLVLQFQAQVGGQLQRITKSLNRKPKVAQETLRDSFASG